MNYKKNVISVILWLLSAIMAGTGAMMVTMPSAPEESQWIGLVIAGVWLAVTGLVAFLLSRGLQKSREKKRKEGKGGIIRKRYKKIKKKK